MLKELIGTSQNALQSYELGLFLGTLVERAAPNEISGDLTVDVMTEAQPGPVRCARVMSDVANHAFQDGKLAITAALG